jgi:hypothetical protein
LNLAAEEDDGRDTSPGVFAPLWFWALLVPAVFLLNFSQRGIVEVYAQSEYNNEPKKQARRGCNKRRKVRARRPYLWSGDES